MIEFFWRQALAPFGTLLRHHPSVWECVWPESRGHLAIGTGNDSDICWSEQFGAGVGSDVVGRIVTSRAEKNAHSSHWSVSCFHPQWKGTHPCRETHGEVYLHGEEQVAVGFCWCGIFESYPDCRILGQVHGSHTLMCVFAQ